MTANTQPIFVGVARNESCKIKTGVTSGDGTGSTRLFQASNENGSRVHAISVAFIGAVSSQSVLRLWVESSTVYTLIAEIPLTTYTRVQGVPAPILSLLDYVHLPYIDPADRFLTLDAGDSLYVSVYDTIESDIHITAFAGDY